MLLRRIAQSFAVLLFLGAAPVVAQTSEPAVTFRSGVDLVSVAAVV
jgi:hypothetical protein